MTSKCYHIIPDDEIHLHTTSDRCKCMPILKHEGNKILIMHNSQDSKLSYREKLISMINPN